MTYNSKFTGTELDKVLDGRINSFRQSLLGDNTIVLATNTEVLFVNNGALTSEVVAPTYITSRWDVTNSKVAMPEELDHPTYVFDMSPLFTPSSENVGVFILRAYIDESGTRDFSTDPNIRTYKTTQKGTDYVSMVATWFFGEGTGYDAKNNGVYFTIESEIGGTVSLPYHVIYRT